MGTALATLPLLGLPLVLFTRRERNPNLSFLVCWQAGVMGKGATRTYGSDDLLPVGSPKNAALVASDTLTITAAI